MTNLVSIPKKNTNNNNEDKKKMTRGVLSAEAVRRLAKKGNRVQASSKVGFQLIKYPDNHVHEVPERMEGAAMIEYIGFQPETAQKLWRTYYPDAQKHVHGSLDLTIRPRENLPDSKIRRAQTLSAERPFSSNRPGRRSSPELD